MDNMIKRIERNYNFKLTEQNKELIRSLLMETDLLKIEIYEAISKELDTRLQDLKCRA